MITDALPQGFIERVNQYEYSFVKFVVDNYPISAIKDMESVLMAAWEGYKDAQPSWRQLNFSTIKSDLATTNDVCAYAEDNQEAITLCNSIGDYLVSRLQEVLRPCDFHLNSIDNSFPFVLRTYCLSCEEADSPAHNLDVRYWEEDYTHGLKPQTIIPHLKTPFVLMLLRYTYYHIVFRRMLDDAEYRRNIGFSPRFDFSKVTKVDWGKYSPREVCEQYAITWKGGALYNNDIIDPLAFKIKNQDEVPHAWYLTLVETEGRRLRQDYTYLRKHFNRRFVASLMEWHQYYFNYLVECLHNCEEYKDYPIEKLVPPTKTSEPKRKIADESRALTPLGMSCRKAITAKIRECRTAADFGALLYKFQYDLKFFSKGILSNNEYYLCMQQMGKVHFDSSGDFSNCNKGYNLAMNRASKK